MTRKTTVAKLIVLAVFLLVVSPVAALSAWAWLSSAKGAARADAASTKAQAAPARQETGQDKDKRERMEVEIVNVLPTGFDPAEITRPRGRFILHVSNRSGVHELDLRLDRETGERQREARLKRGRLGWHSVLDLPPGAYTLSAAGQTEWVCRINITPN